MFFNHSIKCRHVASGTFRFGISALAQNKRFSTNIKEHEFEVASFDDVDPEEKAQQEEKLEKLRNKSGLLPKDFNRQHGKPPFDSPEHDFHNELQYKRKMYGRYGQASKVNPSILWPSKKELEALKEYEAICHPHTIHELIEQVKTQKKKEEMEKKERQERILARMKKNEEEIMAFRDKVYKKFMEAKEAKEKKNQLIAEIRKKFGYDIDVRHEKFKEELSRVEEEQKKKKAEEKKAAKMEKKKFIQEQKLAVLRENPVPSETQTRMPNDVSSNKE